MISDLPILKIAELRQYHPNVPILALTATATSGVIEDIQDKLQFSQKNLLKTSFARPNLIYAVKYSENKDRDVIEMVQKMKGSGIIYVRSRRKSIEIARILAQEGVSAAYYNAGLEHQITVGGSAKLDLRENPCYCGHQCIWNGY